MKKFKKFLMAVIAIMGIILLGYHGEKGFVAFTTNPTFIDFTFTAAIIVWSLMFMIWIKDWTQKNIRDKWQEKNIKRLKAFCTALISLNIGITLANIDTLMKVVTVYELIPILIIPYMGIMLYALKEDKNTGWIGGDPSKQPKGGEINH